MMATTQRLSRLRLQLSITTVFALFMLIGGILLASNIMSNLRLAHSTDILLAAIADNGGTLPRPTDEPDAFDDILIGDEGAYDTRFFTVAYSDGRIGHVDVSGIGTINAAQAASIANRCLEDRRDSGYTDGFRYLVREEESDTTVICVDRTRQLATIKTVFLLNLQAMYIGIIIAGIVMFTVSKKILFPLVESNEKQRRFAQDAGHDIKTPLAVISADIELVELESGESEWTADIRSQVAELTELTDDLIFLSRMDADRADMTRKKVFSLSDIANYQAASYRNLAEIRGKAFNYDIEENISMFGDEHSIKKLLGVLLDNATKYSPAGGQVSLRLAQQGKTALVTITNEADTAKVDTSHWFERFWRDEESRKQGNGYGLGLSIAEAVTTAEHGRIKAMTDRDKNTVTLTIQLPIAKEA